ncbi:MAG: hypothetical protein U1C46_03460 [Bacteroidales bacterium]|nr:hypothetical protein [Bacteroidales bacterium]MDZ4203857.1 hypothetical protein [Bacteroidales bacterium]
MVQKIIKWAPRVLAILAILFMMLFSLDCFDGQPVIGKQILCFLIHNISALIVIVVLIVAWKRELAGGILFLLAALAGSVYFRGFSGNSGVLIIMAPLALAGILFIIHHILISKKQKSD